MAPIRRPNGSQQGFSANSSWRVAVYIRLSRDDGNDESLSVTNQRKIITEYMERSFEGSYVITDFYIDDGITGTDYERPEFQRMIKDINGGRINCVVCKNLSRAFRNYSDQGYFLESYFPLHNTRFVTISDPKVDSWLRPETIQNLEVPITGLMNDRFACKTSNDIRETFNTKRRKGEFIGAFAPYGYKKPPSDKNRLVVDDEAASVVRDIFKWYIDGCSKAGIVKKLNTLGIPNPTEYKRRLGFSYHNPNNNVNDGLWSLNTVSRILRNKMYVGCMVQGRQRVISYKVHDKVAVPEKDWFVVENTHEPLVSPEVFETVQCLQSRHTRAAPSQNILYLFSGFLRCADCGKALTRKQSKNHVYYSCRTYSQKSKEKCTKHSVREDILRRSMLQTLQYLISLADIQTVVSAVEKTEAARDEAERAKRLLSRRLRELEKLNGALDSLYADWKAEEITKEEYHRMKARFSRQAEVLNQTVLSLKDELTSIKNCPEKEAPYLAEFMNNRGITYIERSLLAELVNVIHVYEGGKIRVEFNCRDVFGS